MNNYKFALPQHSITIFNLLIYLCILLIPTFGNSQAFQRFFGNTMDDSFSKVIKDGSNYYVLGQTEPSVGATPHATVTRLDAQGQHEWTLTLGIPSIWNDAIIIPGGDLLVVGSTLPFDASTNSLMGRVSSAGSGNFSWLRSYAMPGRDFFNRIINNPAPQNGAFPYYILGSQNEPGSTPTTEDVVLFNLDATGDFNWKKIYNQSGDDEFYRDFDVFPNGDLLIAGNGVHGLIYKTDKTGDAFSGVQIPFIVFNDVGIESSGGFYATANNFTNGDAHILKFDQDFLLVWDVIIPQLTSIGQVWEGIPGVIYATGRGSFGGEDRDVIIKLIGNSPNIVWVKYLDAGSGFFGGSSWLMPGNEIAFTDARIISGGLGGDCAFISVSDLDLLSACMVSEDMATLIFADPLPDSPEPPIVEFQDISSSTDLFPMSLNWLEGEVCTNDSCGVTISLLDLDGCGMIQATANASGPAPYSYQWCDGQTTSETTTILPCGVHEFCVTVTCADGSTSTASALINVTDNIPPTAICIPPEGVVLDSNCVFMVTPAFIDGGSFDNCQIQSMSVSPTMLTGCGIFPVTLTVTDWCGNVSTCTTDIQTIEDVPPSLINCPQDQTVIGVLDNDGICTADVQIMSPIASDLCSSPVSLTNSFNNSTDASGTYPLGTTTVVWTATDACGNEVSCSFDVIVSCDTTVCCPEFSLVQLETIKPCSGDSICSDGAVSFPMENATVDLIACKNILQTYYIVPNLPGFIYTWNVSGGNLSSTQGNNPGEIIWGSGSEGFFEVIISDSTGTCIDSISQKICLLDSPHAAFTVAPSTTVCMNQSVTFTNSSIGGNSYYWDFGNGTSSILENPPPVSYSTPGTYTVVLSVSNDSDNHEFPCGCIDTATVIITVLQGIGPEITTENCKKMLCPLDTITYCINSGCAPYNWTVNGGSIITNNGSCITVQWDATAPSTIPASVSVTTGCPGQCGSSAVLNVPVLWPNLPIIGEKIVCVNDIITYSLPVMPGTFYNWSITGGSIVGPFTNTPTINVKWDNLIGPWIISCSYDNPYSGCSGTSTCPVDVRKRFIVDGPSPVCVNVPSVYQVDASSGGTADWTINGNPNVDYTSSSLSTASSISVTWLIPGNYTVTAKPSIPSNFCNPSAEIQVQVKPIPIFNTIVGPVDVCPNQLYDYTVSSNLSSGNFTWSFGAGSSSGTISPYGTNNSMASVNFTGSGSWILVAKQTVDGCTDSTSIIIDKVPVPILMPPATITKCIGGQAIVTVDPSGGPGPYTWSTSSEASLINGQGTGTATYEIHGNGSITVSNCCGASNVINVIATSPPPISITQTGKLCDGDLKLMAPAGGTYQWCGGSSSTNGIISVFNPGTYTVKMKFPDGCISTASVTVPPVPIPSVSISTGDPIKWCIPASPSVILQAFTLSTGCTYQWFDSNSGPIPGAVSSNYIATSIGSYYVEVDCGGCMATSNIITIIEEICPNPPPGCVGVPNPFGAINVTTPVPITSCDTKEFSVLVSGCSGSMITWDFGDGNSITAISSSTVSHTYTSPGAYFVTATIVCSGCTFIEYINVNIPVIADFIYSVECGLNGSNTITIQNTSQLLGGWTLSTSNVNWTTTTSCGSPNSGNGNTFVFTTSNCSPSVTMDITVNNTSTPKTCIDSKTITINLPTSPILSITGPLTVCKDQTYAFNSSLTGPGYVQYEWTVGGNAVSQDSTLNYAFIGTSATIGLTVKDELGCTFTALHTVTVETPRPLTISPIKICPDCMPPDTLKATPVAGFTNYQWYQNGQLVGTNATHPLCQFNASGNYYVTAEDMLNGNCPITSNTVPVEYYLEPEADIQGESVFCVPANGPYSFSLANSVDVGNYSYLWTAIPPGSVTFSPNNTYNPTITAPGLGTYEIVLTVTDVNTGCMSMDTFCAYLCPNPVVSVSGPSGTLCEGEPHTFTASASPSGDYVYVWSNGVTGPVMTTSQPGFYSVTATSKDCGCSSGPYYVGYIRPKPPAILFPVGCDTVCNSDTIIPPLVLGPGWPSNLQGYNIQWFLDNTNGNPFYTGNSLILADHFNNPLTFGFNDILIVVTYGGCSDTSDVYNLFIEPCCVCKTEITLNSGSLEYPVFCDMHVGFIPIIPCSDDVVTISGIIGFVDSISGEPCEDESIVIWELIKPDNTTIGGTTNFTFFNFSKDIVGDPGSYCLNLTVISSDGNETCTCKVLWSKADCPPCCTDEEEFCERLENAISLNVDNQLCKAALNIGDFGCDSYIEWVDWDYPSQQSGPYIPGDMPMHTYPGSGTYVICYLAIEKDSLGNFCFEKQICDTIDLNCTPCCTDSIAFFNAAPFIQTNGTLGDCSINFVATDLDDCWQISYHWGDQPPFVWDGPFSNNTSVSHTYAGPGAYSVCYLLEELDANGDVCWDYMRCEKIFIECDGGTNCTCDDPIFPTTGNSIFTLLNQGGCSKSLQPAFNLAACDEVFWSYTSSSSSGNMGTSNGNGALLFTFPSAGTYKVCMNIIRIEPDGSGCEEERCQNVIINCGLPPIDCTVPKLFNPGFFEGAIAGDLSSGGQSEGWTAAFGNPEVFTDDGCGDDAYVRLEGNNVTADGLSTETIELEPGVQYSLSFCYRNKKESLSAKKFKVRLSNAPQENLECSGDCILIGEYNLAGEEDIWHEFTGYFSVDQVYNIMTLHVENGSTISGIESSFDIDNVCIQPFDFIDAVDESSNNLGIRLFPNPTKDLLHVQIDKNDLTNGSLQIIDIWGRTLRTISIPTGGGQHELSIATLPPGVYLLKITENGIPIWIEKIIKI